MELAIKRIPATGGNDLNEFFEMDIRISPSIQNLKRALRSRSGISLK
jgi:hypothetical protein